MSTKTIELLKKFRDQNNKLMKEEHFPEYREELVDLNIEIGSTILQLEKGGSDE